MTTIRGSKNVVRLTAGVRRARGRFLLAALCALTAACSFGSLPKNTEMVVEVSANIVVPDQMDQINVRVERADRRAMVVRADNCAMVEKGCPLGPGQTKLPVQMVVVPLKDRSEAFRVYVNGFLQETTVVSRTARTWFVPERSMLLRISLSSDCLGKMDMCPEGQTCVEGGVCGDDPLPPVPLPPDYQQDSGTPPDSVFPDLADEGPDLARDTQPDAIDVAIDGAAKLDMPVDLPADVPQAAPDSTTTADTGVADVARDAGAADTVAIDSARDAGTEGGVGEGPVAPVADGGLDLAADVPLSSPPDAVPDVVPDASPVDSQIRLKDKGASCAASGECRAGLTCLDGACCTQSSCPQCQNCGTDGTCSITVFNADDATGTTCTGASACDATGACKKKNGETCSTAGECASGGCADSRCCVQSCGTCQACTGAGGTCVAVTNADAADTCTGANTCDHAGACKKKPGQTCSVAGECASASCTDNRCCTQSCGTCQACTGAGGTCVAVTNADDADTCTGNSTCNADGACTKKPGQTCTGSAECASGNCLDGVCCTQSSCPQCQNCGAGGTCSITVTSADDTTGTTCAGTNTCDATGACKNKPGPDGGSGDACVPICTGKLCGSDGCGGTCGVCDPGEVCEPTLGICRIPTLAAVEPASTVQQACTGDYRLVATPDSVYTVVGWRDFVFMGEIYRFPRNADGTLGTPIYYGQPSTHLAQPHVLDSRFYLFGDNDGTCCNRDRSDMAPIDPGGGLGSFVQIADLPYSGNGWGTGEPHFSAVRAGRIYLSNTAKEDCCGMSNAPSVAALSAPVNSDGTVGTWRFESGSAVSNRFLMGNSMSLFMIREDYAYVLTFDSSIGQFSMYRAPIAADGTILDQHETVDVSELNFLEKTHSDAWPLLFMPWKGDAIVSPGPLTDGDPWARVYWLKIRPDGSSTHLVAVTETGPAGANALNAEGGQVYLGYQDQILKANLPGGSSSDGGAQDAGGGDPGPEAGPPYAGGADAPAPTVYFYDPFDSLNLIQSPTAFSQVGQWRERFWTDSGYVPAASFTISGGILDFSATMLEPTANEYKVYEVLVTDNSFDTRVQRYLKIRYRVTGISTAFDGTSIGLVSTTDWWNVEFIPLVSGTVIPNGGDTGWQEAVFDLSTHVLDDDHKYTKVFLIIDDANAINATYHLYVDYISIMGELPAGAQQWNATSEFSTTNNPFGAWSSGWTATMGSAFNIYTAKRVVDVPPSVVWYDPTNPDPRAVPNFWKNASASAAYGVQPGQLSMHPGCTANEYTVLRWTSPATATCTVNAQFFAGDIYETDANILKNSTTSLFSAASTTSNPAFASAVQVAVGDTLDFVVGTAADGCACDDTPVEVTVTCPN